MRTRSILALLLAGILPSALAGGFEGLAVMVGQAFDPETGTFAEGAYEILLEAQSAIAEAMAVDPAPEPGELERIAALDVMVSYNLGCLEALAGRSEEAFTRLGHAVESGYADPEWMAQDPDLASLTGDGRFQQLLDGALRNGQAAAGEDCGGDCGEDGGCCGEHSNACE